MILSLPDRPKFHGLRDILNRGARPQGLALEYGYRGKHVAERLTLAVSRTAEIIRRSGIWDLALMAVAFMLYRTVRGLVAGRASEAISHAMHLVELEQRLGMFWEARMQAWVISSETLIKLFNAFYVYAHFPLIVAIGLWLFFFHRSRYLLFRNAFLVSGAIGLVVFAMFPLAPPRLLPWPYGLVDTLAVFSNINYNTQTGAFVNHYAAMPSLHCGWNLLLSIAIFSTAHNLLARAFAVAIPVVMGLCVIVTGNHFILDVCAGAAVALIGLIVALVLERYGWRIWQGMVPKRLAGVSETGV